MKEKYETVSDQPTYDLYEEIASLIRKNPRTWQSIGAVSGLVGGVLTPLLGTVLTAIAWIVNSQETKSVLNVLIIILFCLTIPLLVFGAHCLDLLEKKSASNRRVGEPQLPRRDAAPQHDSVTLDDPAPNLRTIPFGFKRHSVKTRRK